MSESTVEIAEKFAEALQTLEKEREVEPIVGLHAEECEVGNVATPETFRGREGAREFWTTYRKTFDKMESTFRNVFAGEGRATLEWVTKGTEEGKTISYEGVSILEIEDGKVTRFMAYFDPRRIANKVID